VRLLDLEHGLLAFGGDDGLHENRRGARLKRLARGQAPTLDQTLAGQR
jgi:hypothetical protein